MRPTPRVVRGRLNFDGEVHDAARPTVLAYLCCSPHMEGVLPGAILLLISLLL